MIDPMSQAPQAANPIDTLMPYIMQARAAYGSLGGEMSPSAVISLALQMQQSANGGGGLSIPESKDMSKVQEGFRLLDDIESTFSSGTVLKSKLPNFMRGSEARQFDAASRNFADILGRLRSGAQVTEEEEARFRALLPGFGDDPDTVQYKLSRLREELSHITSGAGIGNTYSQGDPMQSNTIVDQYGI